MGTAKPTANDNLPFDFNETLPYKDADVAEVVARMMEERLFLRLLRAYKVEEASGTPDELKEKIRSVHDFQMQICAPMADSILRATAESFTVTGSDNLDRSKGYLFISNHRDIILDSALLNVWMLRNSFRTTQMAIGNNLYFVPWLADFFRLNKGLMIRRDLKGKPFFFYSQMLSDYICENVASGRSVWIAQREGRTKDGYDRTQLGLLKMLFIGQKQGLVKRLRELNIVPTSISYEYEPCDNHKVKSLLDAEIGEEVEKNPRDDLYNMLSGLGEKKGKIHLHFGAPIVELENSEQCDASPKRFFEQLAARLEKEIHRNFQLRGVNYIAYDLLKGNKKYQDKYSAEDVADFNAYMGERLAKIKIGDHRSLAESLFLKLYANPLVAQEEDAKGEGNITS